MGNIVGAYGPVGSSQQRHPQQLMLGVLMAPKKKLVGSASF